MIYPVTMYAAKCGNCKKEFAEKTLYRHDLILELGNQRWNMFDTILYCPDCWSYGKNDEITIDITRFKK